MTKTVYYNYLRTQSEETIKNLSFLRFDGRYQKNDDGWYYIYFEKEGEKLTVSQFGEVTNRFFRNLVGGEFLSDTQRVERLESPQCSSRLCVSVFNFLLFML